MSYCINISHPDFVALREATDMNVHILKAKVAIWMEDNTPDRFPSVEELMSGKDEIFYSKERLNYYQKKAKDIFFQSVWNKPLTPSEIDRINGELRRISQMIGDTDWFLRQTAKGSWYIAGYKNRPVTAEDYYSPYANGMFRQNVSKDKRAAHELLDKKMYEWARKHGISVEALDTLFEKFEGRYDNGIKGVADFANAIIGIADGRSIDTFPEEVAHFAIEILQDHPSIKRAMEEVSKTTEYAEVKEEYKDNYTSEEQFKKETLAKMLAREIVDQFSKQDSVEKSGSIWTYVKTAAKKFIDWVQKGFKKGTEARTELDTIIAPLATAILEGQYLGNLPTTVSPTTVSPTPMYQKEDTPKEKTEDVSIQNKKAFVERVIFEISKRASQIKNQPNMATWETILKKEIATLERQLVKGEMDLAISGFTKLAEMEVGLVYEALNNLYTKENPSGNAVSQAKGTVEMYDSLFRAFVSNMMDAGVPTEEMEELRKGIHNLAVMINNAHGIIDSLERRISVKLVEKSNRNPDGTPIDPNLDPEEVVKETHTDMGYWRLWVGNYKYAESGVVRTIHKIIYNSIQNVKRFAIKKGNELLQAQQTAMASGGKIMDLVELDTDGKPTQYFIREYHWDRYYKEMNEMKKELAAKLGYDHFSKIQTVFLTPEERAVYSKAFADFHSKHSQRITVTKEDGTYTEKQVPNDSYRNARFDEVMSNPAMKAYYDLLIAAKREALSKLPARYRNEKSVYQLPSILKSTLDRLGNSQEGYLSRIGSLAKEALFIDKDDTQFGQLNSFNNKMVPIHFVNPLDDVKDLSFDVARTVTLFAEMAENFKEMNTIAGDLKAIQSTLAKRTYINRKGIRQEGLQTNEYKAIETLIDSAVYGMEKPTISKEIPSNRVTEALGIAGKEFSGSKFSQQLAGFIRNNNLAFNLTTSLSGWLKGSGDSIIEDTIGLYTTHDSKNWSRAEFAKNLMHVVGEIGKAKQTNKMHLILQENEIVDLNRMLYETTKGRVTRKMLNKDLLYTTFATADYGIKGRITLAIYDNHRLYNGVYMTRANYLKVREKETGENSKTAREGFQKEWKELRDQSLYNAYEVVDGQLVVKEEFKEFVTPEVLNNVKGKVEHVTTYVDGTMSKADKGALARTMAGDFLLMHRGWFIGLIDTRFKKENTNMISGEEEIGTYRASLGFLHQAFYQSMIKDKAGLQGAFATWHTLTPAKKRGVIKTVLDLFYLQIVALIAAIANAAADDEEEKDNMTLQYTAYQLNRLLLEQGAAWSPAELIQMIDEPVVGARMIRDLMDLGEAINFDEVYESGMYEGKSHATKWWMKKLPTRNIYELQFPDMKNNFVKQMLDSQYYDWMKEDEEHKVAKKGSSLTNWLFPRWSNMTTDYSPEIEKVLVEDEEEESL